MSRFFARSAVADICGRIWNLILFVILLPFVVILSRRPGIDRLIPEDPAPQRRRVLTKAA